MPRPLRVMVMVAAVGLLSSCAATPKNRTVGRQLPTLASVSGGRFLSRVELDNGDLVVDPAGKSKPGISATTAQALFRATDVVDGAYRFAVLGLGRVTISPAVSASSTTTTGPGTTTATTIGAPGPTTGAGATSTTHATTTTATTAATTTTNPTTSTGASAEPGSTGATVPTSTSAPALPRYHDRLAWVGIAWGADCPARASTSRLATRYVAVILDADTGHSALAYTSRSATACSGPVQAPSVIRPDELVSVPWQPVGPTSTSVRVTMPACSTYFGWTDVPGTGAASVQVVARKPFDPACGSDAAGVVVVGDVVPLGSAQSQVSHAALGPVDALRTLPGG